MATSIPDFKLASAAAGFSLGFGVLTVWEAIKQTVGRLLEASIFTWCGEKSSQTCL